MEVNSGDKQSDVGTIPKDWDVRILATLGTRGRPAIKAGPFGSSLTKDTYTSNGYKVYGQEQVIRGDYNYGDYFISKAHFNELKSCAIAPGDILLSLVGTAGRILVIPPDAPEGIINPRIIRFSFDQKIIHPYFFRFLFESNKYQALLDRSAQGGTMGVLNAGLLRPISIPLPPMSEQRAIAAALSDVDALVAALDRLIAKKRDIKHAAMQELLTGKRRLPGFSSKWGTKRLGDIIEKIVGGGTPSRSNPRFWGNEIPWVTVKDFASFHPQQTQEAITREGLEESSSHLIPKGTLITSTRMALGKVVIYEMDVCINQDLKALFSKANISVKYLYYWFEHHVKVIEDLGSGSTVKGIAISDLKNIEFLLTSLDEQNAIVNALKDMDTEIAALENRRKKTLAMKQGMMQELLTGRIRLVQGGAA